MHLSPLRRVVAVLVAIAATILLAAACGGSDSTDTTVTADGASAQASQSAGGSADDGAGDVDGDGATDQQSDGASGAGSSTSSASAGDIDLTTKPEITDDLLGNYNTLVTTDLVVGDGAEAMPGDMISMQYVGVLGSDGTEFDASWNRGAAFDFQLGAGQVIAGWDEGIVGMRVGGRRVLQIPSAKAYGSSPRGDVIGADADLLFIVDLIDIAPPPPTPAPPTPAPPVDQAFLGDFEGLQTTDLVEGTGPAAKEGDIMAVQYVGVLASDGAEFDSSWSRGAVPFRLVAGRGAVIDGWNQGLIGMKAGGERVIQIPSALAYGEAGAGGAIGPDTDLVFRVHLEELIEAPAAHTLTFGAPAPDEIVTTTLVDGDGDAATIDSTIDAHLVVYFHNDSQMVESTYTNEQSQPVGLTSDGFVPGLTDELIGMQAGEIRQVIIPVAVAFPDGVPPQAGLADDDALVFVVDAQSVS